MFCRNWFRALKAGYLKAFRLCIVLCIMLIASALCEGIVNESGSFYQFMFGYEAGSQYDNWITHVSEGIARPELNDYAPWDRQTNGFGSFVYPDSLQTLQWTTVSNHFILQQWTNVETALIQYGLPYDLVRFDDEDTGRQYFLLRERLNRDYDDNGTETPADDENGSYDLGWGLFVYNPQATCPIVITVPHPNDDYIGVPLAWKAFTQLNAQFMMISGAGREVMWTNQGTYTNSISQSDPSRNAAHPLHITYKMACNYIRALLLNQDSIIGREFSLQVHSYDTDLHLGYANCQVSAGYGQSCLNLPTRDLSQTQPDLINAAGYVIHPANTLGNNTEVLTNNFWAANYSLHPFYYYDGTHLQSVSNHIDLPGYSQNCQMLYTQSSWTNYDVYDPFFHIEMDELPDCYTQNDSTLAWFYGWESDSLAWNERTRYQKVLAFYQPWVDALETSLQPTFVMNDNHIPHVPVLANAVMVSNNVLRLSWQRLYEYDFSSWIILMQRKLYLGNGNYSIIDTLIFNRNNFSALADQATTQLDMFTVPQGYHYTIWMSAKDKSNRTSGVSNSLNIVTYALSPLVTNLSFDRALSDANHISIAWTPVPESTVISGYRIDRRFSEYTSWESLAVLGRNVDSYTDSVFTEPDSLSYEYGVTTLGASGQIYTPGTYCTGYFRCYPAAEMMSISNPPHGFVLLQWHPVTQTLGGFADLPDYYLITKSSAPDFSSPETLSFETLEVEYSDPAPILPIWQQKCFYKVTAMARAVSPGMR